MALLPSHTHILLPPAQLNVTCMEQSLRYLHALQRPMENACWNGARHAWEVEHQEVGQCIEVGQELQTPIKVAHPADVPVSSGRVTALVSAWQLTWHTFS